MTTAHREHELAFRLGMMLLAFKGVDPTVAVDELCNPRGSPPPVVDWRRQSSSDASGLQGA